MVKKLAGKLLGAGVFDLGRCHFYAFSVIWILGRFY
jgi:hypothetical protein